MDWSFLRQMNDSIFDKFPLEEDEVIDENPLKCYCDHCESDTCFAKKGHPCFAKYYWKTVNGFSYIEKDYNCLNSPVGFIKELICDTEFNNKSQSFLKCCTSGNFCNNATNFIPEDGQDYLSLVKMKDTFIVSNALQEKQPLIADNKGEFNKESQLIVPLIFAVFFLLIILVTMAASRRKSRKSSRYHQDCSNADSAEAESYPMNDQRTTRSNPFNRQTSNASSQLPELVDMSLSVRSEAIDSSDPSQISSCTLDSSRTRADQNLRACGRQASFRSRTTYGSTDDESETTRSSQCTQDERESPPRLMAKRGRSLLRGGPFMNANEARRVKKLAAFQMTLGSGNVRNKPENSTGSGAGQPYLTQRSIAHDIELLATVGRGYFGIVWRAEYKGVPVAVKIFSAAAESSWERETDIYQTSLLRHKNILGFIASDRKLEGTSTGFWLVTDFYPMGSLHDFLKANSVSVVDAFRMAFSLANGLAHLHVEIYGVHGKPAIAHRDIKSHNVLVKNDGTCCIADLGMAVRYSSTSNLVDVPTNTRVGTRRYLAPELLENRLNLMDFEAVKATDIYSLGLVYWELLRRATSPAEPPTRASDQAGPASHAGVADYPMELCDCYEAPYQQYVSVDPSTDEMREVVCVAKLRPVMSPRWSSFAPMRDYATLMSECWYEKSQARLSALRVRKSLSDLARHHFNTSLEYD